MSIIRYDDGATRDTATMCNHCKGNCLCPGMKMSINASPGCGGGTCTCPVQNDNPIGTRGRAARGTQAFDRDA